MPLCQIALMSDPLRPLKTKTSPANGSRPSPLAPAKRGHAYRGAYQCDPLRSKFEHLPQRGSFAQRCQHPPQGAKVDVSANTDVPTIAQFDFDKPGRRRGPRRWRWAWSSLGRHGRQGRRDHLHRHEHRYVRRCRQYALAHLPPPGKQKALADVVAGCDRSDRRARSLRLSHDAQFIRCAPAPPTLTPGDDLHHAIHRYTSSAT